MGYVALLRRRRVLLLWGAQTLSVFGDRLYAMAIMWIAWKQAGAAAMGLVAIAESVPYIVMGTVGRRWMPRFASLGRLAGVDAARMVLVALLPLAWHLFGTAGMLALACALGVGGALFDPNLGALVPDLVEPQQVQAMNGLMDLTGRIARVAGPGTAGLLLVLVPQPTLFLADALTFAVSACALSVLGRHAVAGPVDRRPGPTAGRQPGARVLLRTHPATGAMVGVHGLGIFAQSAALAMPALLATLHAGAAGYGLVLAMTGLGALGGNMLAGNLTLPARLPVLYCGLWACSGLALAATGQSGSLIVLLALSLLGGTLAPFLQVSLSTHLSSFPPAARLRLMTVDQTVIRTAGTLSMLAVPALAASDPARGFLTAGATLAGLATAGAGLAVWWSRTREPLSELPELELARD